MSKKNKGEKKGFFGRLFGAGKEGEAGAEGGAGATPPGQGGDPGELTMAPGYAPGDGGDLTMMPGYAHAPANSSDTGHVSFGTGRHARPPVPGPAPFDADAPERTIAPGYAAGDEDDGLGELTMAPGYMPSKPGTPDTFADPFASGSAPGAAAPADPFAAPSAGNDPFADLGGGADMMTMAPGYAAGGPAAAPPGPGPGRSGKKQAPPADPFADLGQGEMTMAPGYIADVAAAKGAAPAGAADPFADFDLGAPTAAAPAPADPFADLGAGELTMAPGYAPGSAAHPAPLGGGKAGKKGAAPPPADPFVDLGDLGPGDFTMAPGYAGAAGGKKPSPAADPFADLGPELTAPPSYGAKKPPLAADPFADLEVEPPQDPAMTMAPMYAPKVPIPGPTGVGDPFDIDLGGPAIAADAFEFDPAPPQPSKPARTAAERAASPSSSSDGEAFDPFGPALLDDPFADASGAAPVATPPPAAGLPPVATPLPPSKPLAALPAAAQAGDDDDDFRGERTMVDLNTDVEMLATLESTDELKAVPAELELDPELDLDLGGGVAAPPPVAALPPTPAPMAVPPRAAPRARAMFASARPEGGGVRHVGAAPEVVLDAARGTVLAPRHEGGWTGVPQGFAVLSDGSVIGRGQVSGRDVVVLAAATASDAEVRLAPFPAGVKVDRVTRAVLWPAALEAQLAWRPARVARTDEGLSFALPEGARFEEDGSVVLPAAPATTATTVAPRDPSHGAVAARFEFLGVVEEVHDDGWSRLTLPAGATVEGERLLLPAPARRDGAPALLRPERLPDGRLALALPARAQQGRDGAVWVPPSAAPAEAASEPWADRDAAVVDTRTYAGVREEALADGWLRLELPDGARVERAGGRPRVVIPAEFGRLGDAAALLELDRLPCGSLAFDLPADAECLGTRVLVPPVSTETAPTPRPTTSSEKRPSTRVEVAPTPATAPVAVAEVNVDEPRGGDKTDPSSRKMKALDRFRNKEKKPQGDSMTFDGVLRGQADVAPTGGAVAEGVPVPAVDPVVEEPVAVAAAVEAGAAAAEDELGPATSAASSDGPAPEAAAPESEPDESGSAVETTEATESAEGDVGDEGSRRTGRKKKRKGKKGDGGDA